MIRHYKQWLIGSILFLAITLGSCQKERFVDDLNEGAETQSEQQYIASEDMVAGEAIIKLSSDGAIPLDALRSNLRSSLRSESSDVKLTPVFNIGGKFEGRQRRHGLHLWYKVEFDKTADLQTVFDKLAKEKGIDEVSGNLIAKQAKASYTPANLAIPFAAHEGGYNKGYPGFNDPYLIYQWHYQNEGNPYSSVIKAGADINLFKAWDVEKGDGRVVVAIIDSGVDFDHEDLSESKWENPEHPGTYGYNAKEDNYDIRAGFHGTHVAGTIAARNGNGLGVAGIAGGDSKGPGVKLMSVQIFDQDRPGAVIGAGSENNADVNQIARAIQWAADNGAHIANCSWGFNVGQPGTNIPAIKDALQYFVDEAGKDDNGKQAQGSPMAGGVIFFASGNEGSIGGDVYPAMYESVIAVGAFGYDMIRTNYGNIAPWLDIMAPGGVTGSKGSSKHFGVLSTVTTTFGDLIDQPGGSLSSYLYYDGKNNYAYMQGTSMATPHVTGVAALVLSKYGKDGYTNEDLKNNLLTALKPIDHRNVSDSYNGQIRKMLGAGYIDAAVALEDNTNAAPKLGDIEVKDLSFKEATISFLPAVDADASSKMATLYIVKLTTGGSEVESFEIPNYGHQPDVKITHKFTGLKDNTEYSVSIESKDRWGNSTTKTQKFTTPRNNPAEVVDLPTTPIVLTKDKAFLVQKYQIVDKDGHTWSIKDQQLPKGVQLKSTKEGVEITYLLGQIPVGDYSLSFTIVDELGMETPVTLQLKVVNYKAPELVADFGTVELSSSASPVEVKLSDKFKSSIGLPLTFTATSSSPEIAEATIDAATGTLRITPKKAGTTFIEVVANDGVSSTKTSFSVTVLSGGEGGNSAYVLFPVPATYKLNVQSLTREPVKMAITSLRGEQLIETSATFGKTDIATVDISKLVPGTYRIHLTSGGKKTTRTFIKN